MQRMLHVTTECSLQQQVEFMHKYSSLMRLCFMEYSINALLDWLPVERELFFDSPTFSQHRMPMQSYRTIVVATCDVFRQDNLVTGNEEWAALNAAASACIDRCIRVCKFKLFKLPEPVLKGPHLLPEQFVEEALHKHVRLMGGADVALQVLQGNEKQAYACSVLQANLKVFALPECVAMQQMEAIDRLHSACSKRLVAAQQMSFCSLCCINGKSMQMDGGGSGLLHSKLRYCCQTGRLSCITCPQGSVVTVNLVGVLLKICSTYFYLCPGCTMVRPWSSEGGMDLCPWLLLPSTPQGGGTCKCSSSSSSASDGTSNKQQACMVCNSKSIVPRGSMLLPNVEEKTICRVHLCSRHAPPEHIIGMVTSMQQFGTAVSFHVAQHHSFR